MMPARKQMTWKETLAFREQLETIDTLTPAQLAHAYALCDEFGASFDGIWDRAEIVQGTILLHHKYPSPETAEELRKAVQELLHSVNPVLAREILEAGL